MGRYELLKVTPFGFIFELERDTFYFAEEVAIYLNGSFYRMANTNVISLFGLECDTVYDVKAGNVSFSVKTHKPEYVINVKDYNYAINMAIYTAPVGSVVYIPKGEYIVEQILLISGVDIYLERGAVLRQSIDRDKLAIIKGYQKNYDHSQVSINASWEGHPLDCYASLIYGKDIENVHIYGEGIIDGSGDIGGFWINPKVKNKAFRPKNILLVNCKNIEISGLTSMNSASWNIHPFYCEKLAFRGLTIKSDANSPNTDGINPESCIDVQIIGCHFDVGDDCIAIKAGKYYMSVAHYKPSRDIVVRNCLMMNGHGGVVIGSEMSCGVYNVLVTKCLFMNTDRGLRIKTRRGRGKTAIVDGIKFEDVQMDSVKHCFVINMFYNCDPDGKSEYVRSKDFHEKDELTPTVRNISFTGIKASDIKGSGVFIYGLPENPVSNIRITGNLFEFSDERVTECPAMMDDFEPVENLGFYIKNSRPVVFDDNEIIGDCETVM